MEFEEVKYGMLMMVLCDREGRIYDVWITFGSVHEVRAFREVYDYESAKSSNTELFGRFFRALLKEGVLIPPSQLEAWFLSTAHQEEDIDLSIQSWHIFRRYRLKRVYRILREYKLHKLRLMI